MNPSRALQLIAAFLLLPPFTACAFFGGAVEGQVLEQGTNTPIVGAIVIGRWRGHLATFAHGKAVCYHILSTTTNENGRYSFSAWKKEFTADWQRNVRPEHVVLTVYKPGYEHARTVKTTAYLKPFTGTPKKRIDHLFHILDTTRCPEAGHSNRNLYALLHALHLEAVAIAVTPEDKQRAEGLESWARSALESTDEPRPVVIQTK